jgi:hypothetical protein
MERGVWGERLKKSFHFKYNKLVFIFSQTHFQEYLHLLR